MRSQRHYSPRHGTVLSPHFNLGVREEAFVYLSKDLGKERNVSTVFLAWSLLCNAENKVIFYNFFLALLSHLQTCIKVGCCNTAETPGSRFPEGM